MTTSTPDSSNIPESFNTQQLQDLLDSAPSKNSPSTGPYDGLTKEEMITLVKRTLDAFDERCGHPVAQKILALTVISNGIGWHTGSGAEAFEEGDKKSGIAWLRDGGKLQAAAVMLGDVSFGPDDFTNPNY